MMDLAGFIAKQESAEMNLGGLQGSSQVRPMPGFR